MTCQFVFSATSPWWNFCRPPPAVGPWIPHHLRPPKRWGVCASLNWEHRIAIPDCAPNPTPAWFCVSPSPRGPCRYLMHEPCSDPTAQQLKVLLTGPLIVCVCVLSPERTQACCSDPVGFRRIWSLMLQLPCWQAVYCQPRVTVCDWSSFTSRQKKQHLLLYQCVPSLHTHTQDKNHQPPAASRDFSHYQIFRASNIWGLPCESNSRVQQCWPVIFSLLWNQHDAWSSHTDMSDRIKA